MDDMEPTIDSPGIPAALPRKKIFAPLIAGKPTLPAGTADVITFDRDELREIFDLYGRKVGGGEWRDYALEFTPPKSGLFGLQALVRICALPHRKKLEVYKQDTYSVIAATGLVLNRGHDLSRVIAVLDRRLKVVPA
jgi:hypothetical protein